MDPTFSSLRLSLLDRGFVFAIAHVRGGGELGRRWYEEGKFAAKPNTFTDFLACARSLVAGGWTSPQRLVARGGSAGGLLMGAVANLAPDLFRAVVAEVPFVDCLTTILDETLPLTVLEWEEWGNPVEDPEIYRVMKSYSPYDNVRVDRRRRPPRPLSGHPGDRRPERPEGGLLGARQVGGQAPGGQPGEPGAARRRRWAPATAGRPAATTPGGTRRSSTHSCSTPWAWPTSPRRLPFGRRSAPTRPGPEPRRPTGRPPGRSGRAGEPAVVVVVVADPDDVAGVAPDAGTVVGTVVPGVAEDEGLNVATNGVRNGVGSTTGMPSTSRVTAGVPNWTVVVPEAGTCWTVPALNSPAHTVDPGRRRVHLHPARARARQGEPVGRVRQRVGRRGTAGARGGGRETGSAGSWVSAGSWSWGGEPWSRPTPPRGGAPSWWWRRSCGASPGGSRSRPVPRRPPRRRPPPAPPSPVGAGGSSSRGPGAGHGRSGPAGSARRRRSAPARRGGRRRRRWGRRDRGIRRCPGPGPGAPPGPRHPPPVRWEPPAPDARSAGRSARRGVRGCPGRGGSSGTEWMSSPRGRPGDDDHDGDHHQHHGHERDGPHPDHSSPNRPPEGKAAHPHRIHSGAGGDIAPGRRLRWP